VADPQPTTSSGPLPATLVIRRRIRAAPEKLFAAWTQPEHLRRWWGPQGTTCPSAEVDLRVDGVYRIANLFPDGSVVWIEGAFEIVEPPKRLVYSWTLSSKPGPAERVTVLFEQHADSTDVTVVHVRIEEGAARADHARGWEGCLDGLSAYAPVL
jgi:uncharacterized protein YndB with AHSA1/START domain